MIAVNDTLEDAPETVNSDPYVDGWFFRVKATDAGELGDLMDAEAYGALCEAEE